MAGSTATARRRPPDPGWPDASGQSQAEAAREGFDAARALGIWRNSRQGYFEAQDAACRPSEPPQERQTPGDALSTTTASYPASCRTATASDTTSGEATSIMARPIITQRMETSGTSRRALVMVLMQWLHDMPAMSSVTSFRGAGCFMEGDYTPGGYMGQGGSKEVLIETRSGGGAALHRRLLTGRSSTCVGYDEGERLTRTAREMHDRVAMGRKEHPSQAELRHAVMLEGEAPAA